LTDGEISIFESGSILLHLGERSDALMPADPRSRCEALEWLFAAPIWTKAGLPSRLN
jgi:glutathione S-transferase